MGHQADLASNGREAIANLASNAYDLVLMDIQMPEMDGLEATAVIRDPSSNVLDHQVPIVAMTAHAMQGDQERCLEGGMDDYVTKPIRPEMIQAAIERQLARRPATSAGS